LDYSRPSWTASPQQSPARIPPANEARNGLVELKIV
jgi:hypothetical protein